MIKIWFLILLSFVTYSSIASELDFRTDVSIGKHQFSIEVPGLSGSDAFKVIREVQIILAFYYSQEELVKEGQIKNGSLLEIAPIIPGPGFNLSVKGDYLEISQEAADKITKAIAISENNPESFGRFFEFASNLFSHNSETIDIFNIKTRTLKSVPTPDFLRDGKFVPTLFFTSNVEIYFEEETLLGKFFKWRDLSGSLNDSLAVFYNDQWCLSMHLTD